jgi:hypothetical protein
MSHGERERRKKRRKVPHILRQEHTIKPKQLSTQPTHYTFSNIPIITNKIIHHQLYRLGLVTHSNSQLLLKL